MPCHYFTICCRQPALRCHVDVTMSMTPPRDVAAAGLPPLDAAAAPLRFVMRKSLCCRATDAAVYFDVVVYAVLPVR